MIDINMYGKPKKGVVTNSQVLLSGTSAEEFEPHFIWGQYFTGKEDINGDMKVNGTAYIDYSYMMRLNSTYINSSYLNTSYLYSDFSEIRDLKNKTLNSEWASILKAYIEEMSAGNITAESLTVTGAAHFFELIIDQVKASGGAVIFTPANGFVVRKVEKIPNAYRLYFLADEMGKHITNMWRQNDQALCQNFNRAKKGQNYDVSNKYYWSLVINTNNDDNNGDAIPINVGTEENQDIQNCHYIDISDTDFDGELLPQVDDEIAMLGYRGDDDIARQNAIYISSYNSLDKELQAPLICQYKGINDFNLTSHKYTWFSGGTTVEGEMNNREANEIRGSFKLTDGKTIEDSLAYLNSYISEVKFSSDENKLAVGNILSYYNELSGQLEEKVSWSYIVQHSDEINLNVVEGLKQTGIDIKSGQITINADTTRFLGNISLYNSDNGVVIYDENEKPKVIINHEKLEKKYSSETSDYEYLPKDQNMTTTQTLNMTEYLKLGDYYTPTKTEYLSRYRNQVQGLYLGNFTTSDSFKITCNLNIRFAHREYDKGIYDVPSWRQSDTGQYTFKYKIFTGNNVTIKEGTIQLHNTWDQEISVSCSLNGDYYINLDYDYIYDADMVQEGMTYYTIGEYFTFKITRSSQGLTFIGMNGIYSSNSQDRYMVYSENGFNCVEKETREIEIGDSNHKIENPKYALGLDPEKGPYWAYNQLSQSWFVPLGVAKLENVYSSDFKDTLILDESGNTITVKGYNVNTNILSHIVVRGTFESGDYYIILPYAEPAQVMIHNYSNKNIFIYARGISNNSKNMYINTRKLNRNTGSWRYEMGQTDEMLWMMGDRDGWNNVSFIDH